MQYCASCQVLSRDGDKCPSCGSRKLREVRQNDPVLLLTADEIECTMIKAAFDDANISHGERMSGTGSPSSVLYGRMPNASYDIFVPFGELENCKEILKDMGVIDENGQRVKKTDMPEQTEQEKEMSPAKRMMVRAGSVVLFIVLVWAAVAATDSIVSAVRAFFHLT